MTDQCQGSPPHTRGKEGLFYLALRFWGITPAHAGKSYLHSIFPSLSRDHPRTRGEKRITRADL